MSTKNILENLSQKDKKNLYISVSILFLLILVIVGISSFNFGKNQSQQVNSPIPIVDVSKITSNNGYQRVLGEQVYNWTGRIVDKQEYYLVLETVNSGTDGKNIINKITANINQSTNMLKWDLTSAPSNTTSQDNKTQISYNDLKIGDDIIIKSNNDLNEFNEVTVTDINLLIIP